ncbi:T9SS type B sorting domain-containing protein [Tamlana agarivorans]|uniref:T9SS type B sorting domain-containing protein n=1 Tax=Pseudotamlana agarivorans TaxID=481183 RepID=A0ACC5U4L0_9FLAO|nr:T9SS type B sorting domain-containing protein [Tamlana agarivorans]MBU2949251.1 T9SS type B sorting domain-containing protein [Tamlana agarivorans]
MKKTTFSTFILVLRAFLSKLMTPLCDIKKWNITFVLLFFITLIGQEVIAQVAVPFTPRELAPGETSIRVKGDIALIGNSIIKGKGSTYDLPYNGSTNNNNVDAEYIDIDGDSSTFSSSSAGLNTNITCKKIIYAGLYWASAYPNGVGDGSAFGGTTREDDWNKIKFKLPTGAYIDLEATGSEIILDGLNANYLTGSGPVKDGPIVCYKNVTTLLQGLADADGTYTVANLRATQGKRNGGCAGGWTLVVIYESPDLPSKFISTFDGYAVVQNSQADVDIDILGFQTLPSPLPVNAKIGVASLEGDVGISGDTFQFKANSNSNFTPLFDALNPSTNFFNSRITSDGAYMLDRNPNSENSLGFDIKNIVLPNNGNAILPNDETGGTLKLTTSGDGIGPFLTTFAVDIIEPKVVLTKAVQDDQGTDIGGGIVNLGDDLKYVISIENIGNDDAKDLTIRDALPINVDFNYPGDIDFVTPGITHTYDAVTNEIVFTVPQSLVTKKEGPTDIDISEIIFSVKVVQTCNELSDACSNIIQNQAFATYKGVTNDTYEITDEPSYEFNAGNNCLLAPQATNFLADIDNCIFEEDVILCGDRTEIIAPDGYDAYLWSTDPTFSDSSQELGSDQNIYVTNPGSYYVRNSAIAPCQSTEKKFNVAYFGGNVGNPVSSFADEIVICGNDGSELPNFYLCGLNDVRNIQTSLTNYQSIIWEKLNETSCNAVTQVNCANTDPGCQWDFLSSGPDFDLSQSGEYRLTIEYDGGCFNQFYFNSYTNLLNPTIETQDIICNTKGEITVNNIPSDYEFSYDGGAYTDENSYEVTSPGFHNVKIKQKGVNVNPCVFEYEVLVDEFEPTLEVTAFNATCYGDIDGRIKLSVNGGNNNDYSYLITQGSDIKGDTGWVSNKSHEFINLTSGTYDIKVSLEDGCEFTESVDIIAPDDLVISASSSPITCGNGAVSISATGGTLDYSFVDLSEPHNIQDHGDFVVTTAGTYNYRVTDVNGCIKDVSVEVDELAPPTFSVVGSDLNCYGEVSAQIVFNLTNANGYTIEYSIDNGASYSSNATFPNLAVGTYPTMIKYSLNGVECLSPATDVIIDGPDDALTASAGVSELAGCGANGEGTLRITNPQGGVPPYEFSFDNQSTWISSNSAEVLPGTYDLYIRDSSGCIFPMPGIVLDQEPLPPTIDDNIDPQYNCDGTANATVQVTNNGGANFEYTYLLNGIENTNTADPTTFLNVPNGNHTISVTYKLLDAPTYSNLLLETFGSGDDTESPGINTAFYCFEYQQAPPYCKGSQNIQDGDYSVTSHIESPYGDWSQPGDHTSNNTDPNGRALVVNIGDQLPEDDVLYKKTINDIIPNQPINFELFVYNLMQSHTTKFDPNLTIALVDASGTEISSFATGDVPKTERWENYPKTPITLNPGNNTTLEFLVRSTVRQTSGNDVAIDDIKIYQLPISCIDQVDFPIIIDADRAFSADAVSATDVTCNGADDATITISASNFDTTNGYQYSIDGGTNWNTVTTSPYDITGLDDNGGNPYNVQIRYDAVSTGCEVSIPQTISEPSEIQLSLTPTQATCTTGASIEAVVTGGTPPYTMELLDTAGVVVNTFPNSGILSNVAVGDYSVRVTDANSCTPTGTFDVKIESVGTPTADIDITKPCLDLGTGATIRIDPIDGKRPFRYRYDSTNGNITYQASQELTGLAPGSYVVWMIDANNCEANLGTHIIAGGIGVSAQLDKGLDCSASPDAEISGTITAGYAPYTVTLAQGTGTVNLTGSTFTLETANAGTYQFEVTDAEGCTSLSPEITVSTISNPTATTTDTNPSCFGDTNGSVVINAVGGATPYEYSFDGSVFTNNASYSGLSAGVTYNYSVRDANQCEFSGDITLSEPTELIVNASVTDLSCDTSNVEQPAVVTIDIPTTGTAPYQYSFDGTNFSNTRTLDVFDDGTTQTINYSVRDANGCTLGGSVTVDPLDSPTDLSFSSNALTCTAPATGVSVTAVGGVMPLTFEIIDPTGSAVSNTDGNFTGLGPDTYIFKVTDANGCSYSEAYTIGSVTPIALVARVTSDVLCFGGTTGAIQLEVSGFSGTYSYSVDLGTPITGQSAATIDLLNYAAGTYSVTVTDDVTGCTATDDVTVGEPTAALGLAEINNVNANCDNAEAQVTVEATGGTPNYTYAFVQVGVSPTTGDYTSSAIANLNPSTATVWDVYVKDANDCTEVIQVTVDSDGTPALSIAVNNGCTLPFEIEAIPDSSLGGVAPFEYSLNGGAYTTNPVFTVNTDGLQTVTIRDANGCIASATTTLNPILTGSASLTKDLTCSVPSDATIELSVSGGDTSAPYVYQVSTDGGLTYSNITVTSTYSTSLAGDYQFKFIDANNCEVITEVITVNPTVLPNITNVFQTQFINCHGEETAAIDITHDPSLGLAPFVFNVTNTTTGTDYGTQTSGLAAGDYTITVTDAKGCTDTETIIIGEPDPLVLVHDTTPVRCVDDGTGTGTNVSLGEVIINSVSGGTGSYTYHVTGNGFDKSITGQDGSTAVFEVVDFGLYEIIITDDNGCSVLQQDVLVASPPDDLDIAIDAAASSCALGATVDVSIGTSSTITGAGPFYFAVYTGPSTEYIVGDPDWILGTGSPVSATFTGLISGITYTFVVYDTVTGCYYYEVADTPTPSDSTLAIDNLTPNNITCTGSADGSVSFDIVSTYGTDANVSYEVFDALSLVSTGVSGTGTVPSNGTLSITNLGLLDFGNYIIIVEEAIGAPNAGCSVTDLPFNISESAIELVLTASSTRNENCNELGIISAAAQHGTAPYEYLVLVNTASTPVASTTGWDAASTYERAEGDYTVYVKDAYGCIKEVDVSVVKDAEPTINAVAQQCFDGTSFDITLSGTTFDTNATYAIGTGGAAGAYTTNDTFSITAAGTYDLFIKDANDCVATTTYIVNAQLTLDVIGTELDCVPTDASFTFTPNGGDGTYGSYEVSTNGGSIYFPITTGYTTSTPGNYIFRVTDGAGCEAVSSEIIVAPTVTPTLTEVHTDVTCTTGNDGQIVVTAGDGVAPFEYGIDDGSGIVYQPSNIFNGLIAGDYDVFVRDSKSCVSLPITVTITEPVLLDVDLVSSSPLQCGVNNTTQGAEITAVATHGTAPYLYSFNGGPFTTSDTYSTNIAGVVSVTVKDANGCTDNNSFTITNLTPPSDMDISSSIVTCNNLTSEVTISNIIDGFGPFTYEIIAPASATSNVTGASNGVFTGLLPDTYAFRVIDFNGCYYDESFTVDPAVDINVSGSVTSDVSCYSGTNGEAVFTVTNVPTTFTPVLTSTSPLVGTESVSVSGNTVTVTGLDAITYILTITDNDTGCTADTDVTITEPAAALNLTAIATNVHCNEYNSTITVTPADGTPGYSYAVVPSGATAPTVFTPNTNVLVVDTNSGADLDWDVYVQDANGCIEFTTVNVILETMPTVMAPAIATCVTAGGTYGFTATGADGVAPYEYSIGNGFQTSPTFTGLTAGTYTVTIKDANGCEGTSTSVTVYENLDLYATIVSHPTCLDNDGVIDVNATGGSSNYTYTISPSAGITQTTTGFEGLTHTIEYTITVTDNDTGCALDTKVTLEEPTPVSFTTDVIDVTCFGGTDGQITVNLDATQDNPIYSYEIIGSLNNGTMVPAQASNVFSGLEADTYTVQVTSGRNCVVTQDIIVNEAPEISVPLPTVIQYACITDTNTSNYATITIDNSLISGVSGGSGNYAIYEFIRGTTKVQSSNSPEYTETDLIGGLYTINVYDDKGCVGSTSATIAPFVAIDDLDITVTNAITCVSGEDISVSVNPIGTGTPALQYDIAEVESDGTPISGGFTAINTSGIFTGLDIANYLVTVRNTNTGCSLRKFHYVDDPNTFDITIDNVINVTCFGNNDGEVNVTFIDRVPTPTDESGAFSYIIEDALGNTVLTGSVASSGPETITGLEAGIFTLTAVLTNTPECEVSKAFTIAGPTTALTALETHTDITCDLANGTIAASATGGWPGGYEYQLEKIGGATTAFSSTFTFLDLDAGDYNVNVRDSSGCIASTLVQLVDPTPISITATLDPASALLCYGDATGIINVIATGGQNSNYTYTLNKIAPVLSQTGPQIATNFTELSAGTYNVTVTDGWNCTATSTDIVINEPTTITSNLVIASTQTCIDKTSLTLSATGGTGAYEYSDDPNFGSIIGSFTTSITFDVDPGTYQYYIKDANNCASGISNEIRIDPLPTLTVAIDATSASINCYGDNTGVIVAKAQGGLGNYIYTLQDNLGNDISPVVQNSPGVFTELVAGDYKVFVTSGDCEVTSLPVTISEPSAPLTAPFIVTDVACNGGDDGSIEIIATGGTGVIKYAISPQLNQFFDSGSFINLTVGNYQAVVQDEAGCFVIIDFQIGEPTPVILTEIPTSVIPELCAGDLNGEFSVNITGGTAPYSVTLDDINGSYVTGGATQTQFDFTGLTGGSHTVFVVDAEGCESEWYIDLPESVNLDPHVVVEYDCLNNTSTNRVVVTVDDSIQDLTQVEYSLNGGPYQASNIFIDAPGGFDQFVDVRHANGCIKQTRLFDVDHITQMQVLLEDGVLNQIVVTATGGVAPYEYSLNGGAFSGTDKFLIYESGDYTVTVRDFYGCEASGTRYFEFIDVCIPNYFTPNGDGTLDGWGPGCATQYKDLTVQVFDRYGRKLAELAVNETWDGTYNNEELPSGDYWYVINLNDPLYDKDYVGHFTLYR